MRLETFCRRCERLTNTISHRTYDFIVLDFACKVCKRDKMYFARGCE